MAGRQSLQQSWIKLDIDGLGLDRNEIVGLGMTQALCHEIRGWIGGLGLALSFLAAGAIAVPAAAQDKAKAAKTDASSAAQKAYAAGVKSFDKGKTKAAVASLTTALSKGGLAAPQMAKALFYRGTAHRKQGKPAQAISDLTSAIWLKGGLSDTDRAAAIDQRAAAYQEAGLGTKVPDNLAPGASVPSTAKAGQSPASSSNIKAAGPVAGPATSAWQSTASAQQAAQGATSVAASPSSNISSPKPATPPSLGGISALPVGGDAPAASGSNGATSSSIGSSISQSLSGVGSFFSNMFSSNQTPSSASLEPAASSSVATLTPPQPITTGSTGPQGAAPATESWGTTTAVTPTAPAGATNASAKSANKVPAQVKPPAKQKKLGKFKLQVAALRSQSEAEKVVAELKTKYAAQLGSAVPEIDAAAIGNMGTFYRVRVGPYADTTVPRKLCGRLKPAGFDCVVVTP